MLLVVCVVIFDIVFKTGLFVENALRKKCDCIPKDMKAGKNAWIDGCTRQFIAVSLVQILLLVELNPIRNLVALFIWPPRTKIKSEPVLRP